MSSIVFGFIGRHTAEDLSGIFVPFERVVLRYVLGDLAEDDGWASEALDGVLPTLLEMSRDNNSSKAWVLEGILRPIEVGFDSRMRLFVNGLKIRFNEIFDKSLNERLRGNRERYLATARRKSFLWTALVVIVSTRTIRPEVEILGGRRAPRVHLTRPDYICLATASG